MSVAMLVPVLPPGGLHEAAQIVSRLTLQESSRVSDACLAAGAIGLLVTVLVVSESRRRSRRRPQAHFPTGVHLVYRAPGEGERATDG
jgi:hypothetical protein